MLAHYSRVSLQQRLHPCFVLLLVVLLAIIPTTSAPAHAAVETSTSADIPCDQTPFGRVLNLGAKNQIFLSTKDASSGSSGELNPYHLKQDPTTGVFKEQFVADFGTEPTNISALASVSADLDGDGKAEYVQGFTDANGKYDITVNKNGSDPQTRLESLSSPTQSAMAAGDMLGLRDGSQQVVVASRGSDGSLTVAIFQGIANGGVGSPVAFWKTSAANRSQASNIQVAVGNLNNNQYADIVVSLLQSDGAVKQLIFLEYQPNVQGDVSANAAFNMREHATTTTSNSPSNRVLMTLASLDGSAQDSVVMAWDHQDPSGLTPVLVVSDLRVTNTNGVTTFQNPLVWSIYPISARTFGLAAGDVIGNHRDEIILGYDTSSPAALNIATIGLTDANTDNPKLSTLNTWQDGSNDRNQTNYLSLAVGDLNKDNRAEVVAAFKDANPFGFQTTILSEQFDQLKNPVGLHVTDWSRHDTTINASPSLALGDWDNESLHGIVQGKCAHVEEHIITSVGFIPPYWDNIQGNVYHVGSIGRSVSQEEAAENSLTYHRSNTVSDYVGGGIDVDIPDVFSLSAVAKETGAREDATSNRTTTGVTTSTVTTVGHSWNDDALLYEPAGYNCYSYQLELNNVIVTLDKANLRFCEYQTPSADVSIASEVNSWDANDSTQPYYTSVERDWSSLTLFRGAFTDQSSNKEFAQAAVDDQIRDGSFANSTFTQTANENHPWWQVDLGAVQPLSKIRLWTPTGSLKNFYVFVSNTDFRSISGGDDPNTLLNRPDVQHYTLADLGNGFAMGDAAPSETTFSLPLDAQNNPLQGRYVRVQLADAGVLTLSEVQVFGPNHVNPDRYPLDMRDTTPGDGSFEVLLYNPYHTSPNDVYAWVQVRGNLLWDGRQSNSLNALAIGRGNGIVDWSLTKGNGTSRVAANEIDTTSNVGVEFEAEAGSSGFKLVGGFGKEQSTGLGTENTSSTSWSNDFDMGGLMTGFPHEFDGPKNNWVQNCHYRFQPYYYDLTETSNLGYQQHFPVLDYLVPSASQTVDLFRTNDLAACRNGNQTGTTAQASNDNAQTLPGQPLTLNVLANDVGNNLTITSVGTPQHGNVTHTARTITYTPNPGFVGTDTFSYTISDGDDVVQAVVPQTTQQAVATQATNNGSVTVNVGSFIYLPVVRQ